MISFPCRRAGAAAALAGVLFTLGRAPGAAAADSKQSPLEIDHSPLACVTPRLAPKVEAAVAPDREFDKSFVYFKAANTEDFYYVLMNGVPESLAGVLPRPLPQTPAIDYYLQAIDKEELSKKTPDYAPPVVESENVCKKSSGVVVGAAGAGLTIGLTHEGQDPYPQGFNRQDIAKVILVSGAVVSVEEAARLSAARRPAGGSGKTVALVAGGLVIAGGAIAIASNKSGSSAAKPPTVTAAASPLSGAAPLAVTFSAATTGGSAPLSFAWAFGDGGTASTQNPSHTYGLPGNFTATVTVSDAKGRTATSSVNITASGPPPLLFFEADASWSGANDVDINVLNSGGTAVGQPFRVPCGATENRTERVILQGSSLISGAYSITVTGNSCPPAPAVPIAVVVNVETDQGSLGACTNVFASVSPGQTKTVCQFSIP